MHDFYPRPPRGGRPMSSAFFSASTQFLSTPSARRATGLRSPHGRGNGISIHALREEGDAIKILSCTGQKRFLSTPSARRATNIDMEQFGFALISIHALREEGDRNHGNDAAALRDFYPRPPRGGRRVARMMSPAVIRFLSTPSARRATTTASSRRRSASNFYPRPPRGGRLVSEMVL